MREALTITIDLVKFRVQTGLDDTVELVTDVVPRGPALRCEFPPAVRFYKERLPLRLQARLAGDGAPVVEAAGGRGLR